MAAPTFVGAGTGVVLTAAGNVPGPTGAAGDLVIFQVLRDGVAGGFGFPSWSNMAALNGNTSISFVDSVTSGIGSPTVGTQYLLIGRAVTSAAVSLDISSSGGDDSYSRVYRFSGVAAGTTLASIIENTAAGNTSNQYRNEVGGVAAITDSAVTTTGADRLAVQFVAVDDDNPVDAFTGMAGGTWAEAVPEFLSATGTDGCIQLQTATIASVGTIDGGSYTMSAADNWGVIGFALIPVTSAAAASLVFPTTPPTRMMV